MYFAEIAEFLTATAVRMASPLGNVALPPSFQEK